MKKTILSGISALMLFASAGCSDTWNVYNEATGRISPAVGLDGKTVTSRKAAPTSRAEADPNGVTDDLLSLRLSKTDGTSTEEFPSVADFPLENEFPVGEYILEAYYGDVNIQGFAKPAYYGSHKFVVADKMTTSVGLTATLANSMVTLSYTDAFKGYMSDWTATVNDIEYAKDETRPVYVKPGDVGITVSVKKPNGIEATFQLKKVTAKPRYRYNVTVDVNEGNVGDATLVITFDESFDNTKTIEIDLSDKALGSPLPEMHPDGFDPAAPVSVLSGIAYSTPLSMNIVAQAGIGSATLKTESASLLAQGWPAEIDLVEADAATQARLTALGLETIGLWPEAGKMAVIDFAGVARSLTTIAGDTNEASFTITATDAQMRPCEPVTLRMAVEDVTLELNDNGDTFEPGTPLSVKLSFNGPDVAHNVSFEYFENSSWKPATVLSVNESTSRAAASYIVTIDTPADFDDDLRVRAKCGTVVSSEYVARQAPVDFNVTVNENDVFARYAYVSIESVEGVKAPANDKLVFTLNSAAVTPEWDGNSALIKGLNPGAANELKVEYRKVSKTVTINAEAATQLANSGMEEWTFEKPKSNCVHWYVGGNIWATMNPVSMSQVSSGGNFSYVSTSGTKETTDTRSGSGKAALIRSVGWGSGNTASGNSEGIFGSKVKYVTRGELALGNWDGVNPVYEATPNYGIDFASRPSALSFWYKFNEVKGHKGTAEVSVLDAAGNVLSSASFEIASQGSYVQKQLPLTYTRGAAKAKTLKVIFRSTAADVTLVKKDINCGSVSSSAEHVGSQLYIDDIELIY